MLPPTLAGCVQRNAIPAKVELEKSSGDRLPPEKCKMEDLSDLPDPERSALFALSQWCGGKLSSFLQLDLSQTAELIKLLEQCDCFFPANSPDSAIQWEGTQLAGVSKYLPDKPQKQSPRKVREIKEEEHSTETDPADPFFRIRTTVMSELVSLVL